MNAGQSALSRKPRCFLAVPTCLFMSLVLVKSSEHPAIRQEYRVFSAFGFPFGWFFFGAGVELVDASVGPATLRLTRLGAA